MDIPLFTLSIVACSVKIINFALTPCRKVKVPFKACFNLTFPEQLYLWTGPDGMPISLKDAHEGLLLIREDIRKRQCMKTKAPKGKLALGFLNDLDKFPILEVDPEAIEVESMVSPANEERIVATVLHYMTAS